MNFPGRKPNLNMPADCAKLSVCSNILRAQKTAFIYFILQSLDKISALSSLIGT